MYLQYGAKKKHFYIYMFTSCINQINHKTCTKHQTIAIAVTNFFNEYHTKIAIHNN